AWDSPSLTGPVRSRGIAMKPTACSFRIACCAIRDWDGTSTFPRIWNCRPMRELSSPASALAVAAHPDDVEFGCGGTLAKWAADGCEIHHLICTDGSKGTWDPATDAAVLVATRQDEQRAASRALGGKGDVIFLGWPDGELESGLRQRSQVAYWIRRVKPDVVLGHD